VRRHDDGADVQVTDGVVETWAVGQESRRVQIAAGSRAYVAEHQSAQPIAASADIERSLAWREGRIVLEGETLQEAVAEFNRYNARKLVIADPDLAAEKLVGQFRATEPLTFARRADYLRRMTMCGRQAKVCTAPKSDLVRPNLPL